MYNYIDKKEILAMKEPRAAARMLMDELPVRLANRLMIATLINSTNSNAIMFIISSSSSNINININDSNVSNNSNNSNNSNASSKSSKSSNN